MNNNYVLAFHDTWSEKWGSTFSIGKGIDRFMESTSDIIKIMVSGNIPDDIKKDYEGKRCHSFGEESMCILMPRELYLSVLNQ